MNARSLSAIVLAAAVLAACGTRSTDRAVSGAGIGAGVGALAGPAGAAVGALAGGATGMFTDEDQVYLGEPLWDSDTFD